MPMIRKMTSRSGFTVFEMLVVAGILVILALSTYVFISPQELQRYAKDTRRMQELQILRQITELSGIENIYAGEKEIVYISIPDTSPTCDTIAFSLPPLHAPYQYRCVSKENLRKIDGTGWFPIDITKIAGIGVSLEKLPVDPVNKGKYFYAYIRGSYVFATRTESQRLEKEGEPSVFYTGTSDGLSLLTSSGVMGEPLRLGQAPFVYDTTHRVWVETTPSATYPLITMNASVNPSGLETTGWFRWWEGTSPGSCSDSGGVRTDIGMNVGSGTASADYGINSDVLKFNTQYYFCAIAANSAGLGYSSLIAFQTPASAFVPSITDTTYTVQTETGGGATYPFVSMGASMDPNGRETVAWFRWWATDPATCTDIGGTRTSLGMNLGSGTSPESYGINSDVLEFGKTYYFCAIGENSAGKGFGPLISFRTPASEFVPSITDTTYTVQIETGGGVTYPFATMNASVNPNGKTTTAWFRWWEGANPGICSDTGGTRTLIGMNVGSGATPESYGINSGVLKFNTQYYFCAIAANSAGKGYGSLIAFKTVIPTVQKPSLSAVYVDNLTSTSSKLFATVNPNGSPTTAWFRYSTTLPSACNDTFGTKVGVSNAGSGTTPGQYMYALTGLAPGTIYSFCAIAENSAGKVYDGLQQFLTSGEAPPPPLACSLSLQGSVSQNQRVYTSVNVDGQYAYVTSYDHFGDNDALKIFDISNSSNPQLVSSLLTGGAQDLPKIARIAGNYAYLLTSQRLQIADISSRSAPRIVGEIGTNTTDPNALVVSGNYAYITSMNGRSDSSVLQVFDISTPASPTLVGSTLIGDTAAPRAVYVSGNYAYVAAANLQVFNISNPSNPVFVRSVPLSWLGQGIYGTAQYLYVTTLAASGSLDILDLTNPANPTSVGTLAIGSYVNSVAVENGIAYVGSPGDGKLLVIDVTSPASPRLATSITPQQLYYSPDSIAVSNGSVYVVNGTGSYGSPHVGSLQIFKSSCAPTIIEKPTLSAVYVDALSSIGARLVATVNPNGSPTTAWFRYSTTLPSACNDTFGTKVGVSNAGSGTTPGQYMYALTGLAPGTIYSFCAIAENSVGKVYDGLQQFLTDAAPSPLPSPSCPGVSDSPEPDRTNIVGEWKFDEPTLGLARTIVQDSSGLNNNGTLRSAGLPTTGNDSLGNLVWNPGSLVDGTWISRDATNYALSFDGQGSYAVFVPHNATINMSGPMTVMARVYLNDYNTSPLTAIIHKQRNYQGGFAMHILADGRPEFNVMGLTHSSLGASVKGPKAIPLGKWHHVAGVFDGTKVILYVDGIKVASTPAPNGLAPTDANLAIGMSLPRYWFPGSIDDVRLYKTALTADEIAQYAACPSSPTIEVGSDTITPISARLSATVKNAMPNSKISFKIFQSSGESGGLPPTTCGASFPPAGESDLQSFASGGNETFYVSTDTFARWMSPGQPYDYCARLFHPIYPNGVVDSPVKSFRTIAAISPTVITETPSNITTNNATFHGVIVDTGNVPAPITNRRFEAMWGGGLVRSFSQPSGSYGVGSYAIQTGLNAFHMLDCGTNYTVRAVASNGYSTGYGSWLPFTTLPCPPRAVTLPATSVTGNSATLNGSAYAYVGDGSSSTAWFRYSTTNPGSCNNTFGTPIPAVGGFVFSDGQQSNYSYGISGLTPGTYYYCALTKGWRPDINYGAVVSFEVGSPFEDEESPAPQNCPTDPPLQNTYYLSFDLNFDNGLYTCTMRNLPVPSYFGYACEWGVDRIRNHRCAEIGLDTGVGISLTEHQKWVIGFGGFAWIYKEIGNNPTGLYDKNLIIANEDEVNLQIGNVQVSDTPQGAVDCASGIFENIIEARC